MIKYNIKINSKYVGILKMLNMLKNFESLLYRFCSVMPSNFFLHIVEKFADDERLVNVFCKF